MKKRLALVLAAMMAFSAFAVGCSSSTDEKETTTAAKQEPTTEAPAKETKYDAEKLECTAFWTTHSTSYAIEDGQTLTAEFKSTMLPDVSNFYDTWVFVCASAARDAADYSSANESIVLRGDKNGWATDYKAENFKMTLNGEELAGTDGSGWPTWVDDSKAGLDCKMTVERKGADFTLNCTMVSGENTYEYTVTWTVTTALADTMYLFFTGEQATIDITSVVVK